MTKEKKSWFEMGQTHAEYYPERHPEELIQSDWILLMENISHPANTTHSQEDFNLWHSYFQAWAAGVRKGSTYYKNN